MADYKNIPLGLRTQTQIPLDVKEYIQNELLLSNLGVNGQLAYTYTKGLVVYCIEESTRWEWTEVKPGLEDTGLINQDFIYSDNHIAFGIDYSNKRYNFVAVTSNTDQNNFVRKVILNLYDYPDLDTTNEYVVKSTIIDYILALPTAERTIAETDSKWNIITAYVGEGIIIDQIYELHNTGKGLITAIDPNDLLLIKNSRQNLLDVINVAPEIAGTLPIPQNLTLRIVTDGNAIEEEAGLYINGDTTDSIYLPLVGIGRNTDDINNWIMLNFYKESNKVLFEDKVNFKGIEYGGDYETNFTARSLITKQYLESEINKQKVIPAGSYVLTNADNNYTIFIDNGATAMTISLGAITIPNFCVGFIQKGTADVTFSGVTNPIGLKSKGQGYQTFIERELSTSSFYLLGNTKI